VLFCCAASLAAQNLPAGTALPVSLSSAVKSSDKPGSTIEGKLMQEIALPSGVKIKSGSRVTGHVMEAAKSNGTPSRITLRFEQLDDERQTLPLQVAVRAMAASENVFQAGTPIDASSTYESSDEWVTKQVGGEVVFRGRGYLASDQGKVGTWSGSGVWGKMMPGGDCPASDGNNQEQALWIFSTTACGIYGFPELKLAHAGRNPPIGQVTLESNKNIDIGGGSGWLLLVVAAPASAATN